MPVSAQQHCQGVAQWLPQTSPHVDHPRVLVMRLVDCIWVCAGFSTVGLDKCGTQCRSPPVCPAGLFACLDTFLACRREDLCA
jgi:hypothetical protein